MPTRLTRFICFECERARYIDWRGSSQMGKEWFCIQTSSLFQLMDIGERRNDTQASFCSLIPTAINEFFNIKNLRLLHTPASKTHIKPLVPLIPSRYTVICTYISSISHQARNSACEVCLFAASDVVVLRRKIRPHTYAVKKSNVAMISQCISYGGSE